MAKNIRSVRVCCVVTAAAGIWFCDVPEANMGGGGDGCAVYVHVCKWFLPGCLSTSFSAYYYRLSSFWPIAVGC